MKRVYIKLTFFLIPLLLINGILLSSGFVFCTKNYFIIQKLLQTEFNKDRFVVRFYGTSRTACDISPDDFVYGMTNKYSSAKIQCLNIGIDGEPPGYPLKLQSFYPVRTNLMVIEVFPERDPLAGCDGARLNLGTYQYFSEALKLLVNKTFVLNDLSNLVYIACGKLAYWSYNRHLNGWHEVNFLREGDGLENARNKWAIENTIIPSKDSLMRQYEKYVKLIRKVNIQNKSKIIFIRMPVDGRSATKSKMWLKKFNCIDYLKHEFPEAMFINSEIDFTLSKFHTSEDSHLCSETAREFSYKLGTMIRCYK
jgi:hypothetical protein